MIVDGINVTDLAIGVDRRVVETGDTQLRIPSTIVPVLLNIRTTTAGILTSTVLQTSALVEASINLTNQASANSNMMTLGAGLWELEMTLAASFDFAAAVGTFVTADIVLNYRAADRRLLTRNAAIGSFVDYNRLRLLLDTQTIVKIRGGITGVGQHLDAFAVVNAIRIL